MAKNQSRQIVQKYIDYLNEVLNNTITDSRLVIVGGTQELVYLVSCFQNDKIVPLKLAPQKWLYFRQLVSIQTRKIIVRECRYHYSLSSNPDDEEQWIFRYEYCLEPEDQVPHAHLHLNAIRGGQNLKHIHFPTGRVSIEQVIAHLIIEHGVKPKGQNWFTILADSHQGFTKRRTDPHPHLFP